MLTDREREKARIKTVLGAMPQFATQPDLPSPEVLERYAAKVEALRASLDDEAVRTRRRLFWRR